MMTLADRFARWIAVCEGVVDAARRTRLIAAVPVLVPARRVSVTFPLSS